MLSLSVDHPDIEEFINVKRDLTKVTKANISVRITDDFMKAVIADQPYILSYTREATGEKIEKVVAARDILHQIAQSSWECGEPGVLFWDRIEKWNLLSNTPDFKFAGTNPCGR